MSFCSVRNKNLRCQRAVVGLSILLVWMLLGAGNVSAQQAKRPITLEDLWKVKRLGKPSLSPDGKWAVVDVTTYSMDDNNSTTHLWLLATDGKSQKQLTNGKGESGASWSPDGKSIAFISRSDGDPAQIYLISPDGGEARQLSKLPMAPSGLKWGADSKTLYCVVWTWPDTADDESHRKKEKARKDDMVQAFIIDDALYRVWDRWIADGKRPVVFAVDAAGGKHKNLFAGSQRTLPVSNSIEADYDASSADYDVSPDGKEICFTSGSAKQLGMDYNCDLYVMPLDRPGQPRNITTDNPANDFAPVYSPDGTKIAFSRQTTKFFYADRVRIMVHDRAAGRNREITAKLDRSCHSVQWSPEGDVLFFGAEDKGYHRLYKIAAVEDAVPKAFTSGFTDVSPALSKDGKRIAFLRSSFAMPAVLHTISFETKKPVRCDNFNDALRAEWSLGETKEVYFKGSDDEDVQMWIVYPPNFDAKQKWPLLQIVHGGPHNGVATDFSYRWNLHHFASKGYVVACVNFHGSSGFGQKFTDSALSSADFIPPEVVMILFWIGIVITFLGGLVISIVAWIFASGARAKLSGAFYGLALMLLGPLHFHVVSASVASDMPPKPMIDVMKGTDWMENQPYIDKNRTACAGASYGGYMVAWFNGHTDRFKAMICHAGAYNWHSMMASDVPPWGDQAVLDRHNPQRFAANFKTPTLVLHGEKDYRVPVTQGLEYYNTLRIQGVPTRLIYFPDESHWILQPQNVRLWHREFFAWLERFVGSGPS